LKVKKRKGTMSEQEMPEDGVLDEKKEAGLKIQATYRGFEGRKKAKKARKQKDAATKIQAQYRGHQGRRRVNSIKQETGDSMQITDDTQQETEDIQANFKGREKEKSIEANTENVDEKPGPSEAETEPKKEISEIDSATKIQSNFRGFQARREQTKKQQAAVKIQSRYKGYRSRKDFSKYGEYVPPADEPLEELFRHYMLVTGDNPRWLTRKMIEGHNSADSCWVVVYRKVFDLTELVNDHSQEASFITPIIRNAGKDVSHWFHPRTLDVLTKKTEDGSGLEFYLPDGLFVHCTEKEDSNIIPWWRNYDLIVGIRTERSYEIRFVNVLTGVDTTMEVCKEETLAEIRDRLLAHNSHAKSYVFKFLGRVLDMTKTLGPQLGNCPPTFADSSYIPSIFLYYSDDLTHPSAVNVECEWSE